MQAVDQSVSFVKVSAQLGSLAVDVRNPSSGVTPISPFDDLDLAGHLFDLHAEFFEERSRLRGLGVIGHVGIVSPISNVRSPTRLLMSPG